MFGKIFESTFTGSMVGSGTAVFAVWSYVIAHTRPPGVVEINPKLLAMILGCQEADVEDALCVLCSPDPKSRSKEHQGCRLLRTGEFLYKVPTWEKYRALRNDEERKAYNAEAQRRSRASRKVNPDVNDMSTPVGNVSRGQPRSAQAEAEAEASPSHLPHTLGAVRTARPVAGRPDPECGGAGEENLRHDRRESPFGAVVAAANRQGDVE